MPMQFRKPAVAGADGVALALTKEITMASPVLNGALLGLSVAMPFGPIALLCVQRSIAAGPRLGIVTGLGAACVQGTYATLAIMGAGAFADHLAQWDHPVRLVSAGLLVALGLRILVRRPPAIAAVRPPRADHAFASSVGLALSNPLRRWCRDAAW